MSKKYRPSPHKIDLVKELTGNTILTRRMEKLIDDFNDSVHDLPTNKVLIDAMSHHGEKAQQDMIDFAWDFHIGGVLTILDKKSNYNTSEYPKNSKLNERRDLN